MPSPSDKLRPHLAALTDALTAVANGQEPPDDPGDVFDQALAAALAHAGHDPFQLSVTLAELVATNVRRLRSEAGLRQDELADRMAALGFGWKRTTVAETERRSDPDEQPPRLPRRLSNEEMFGLAVLFGVPVIELWEVPPGVVVDFGADGLANLTPGQTQELVVGRRGAVGQGGPTWAVAANAVAPGTEVDRPAKRLWRTRRAKGGK